MEQKLDPNVAPNTHLELKTSKLETSLSMDQGRGAVKSGPKKLLTQKMF